MRFVIEYTMDMIALIVLSKFLINNLFNFYLKRLLIYKL